MAIKALGFLARLSCRQAMLNTEDLLLNADRRSPEFLEQYLEAVEAVRLKSPQEALDMAETGLRLAALISEEIHGRQPCQRSIAKAWATLGAALRALTRLAETEWAYRMAARHLRWANASKVERAELCRRLAFLRRDQGRFMESRRLLQSAIDWYRSERRLGLLGQAFADMARTLLTEGEDLVAAEQYLKRSLQYLGKDDDTYRLSAHYSLVTIYSVEEKLGQSEDLLALVRELRKHPICSEGSPVAAKVARVEGLALLKDGRLDEAAAALDVARKELLRHEDPLNAGVASMDLALIWLRQQRFAECQSLAGELFPLFKVLKIDREATAALTLFVTSATQQKLSEAVVMEVKQRLQHRNLQSLC